MLCDHNLNSNMNGWSPWGTFTLFELELVGRATGIFRSRPSLKPTSSPTASSPFHNYSLSDPVIFRAFCFLEKNRINTKKDYNWKRGRKGYHPTTTRLNFIARAWGSCLIRDLTEKYQLVSSHKASIPIFCPSVSRLCSGFPSLCPSASRLCPGIPQFLSWCL